jgi:hypothetical protein
MTTLKSILSPADHKLLGYPRKLILLSPDQSEESIIREHLNHRSEHGY